MICFLSCFKTARTLCAGGSAKRRKIMTNYPDKAIHPLTGKEVIVPAIREMEAMEEMEE